MMNTKLKVILKDLLFYIIYLMRPFVGTEKTILSRVTWLLLVIALPVTYCPQSHSQEPSWKDLQPNELGSIMVVMYHDIRTPESTWVRTPKNFEKDLLALYEKKYRPVSLADFVTGNIDMENGYSPVVLTFDDGTAGQFQVIDKNGEKAPDPRTAVGILEHFGIDHPGFKSKATFFLNGRTPFKESDWVSYKLNYLLSHGMDIGNHTSKHQNLHSQEMASSEAIQSAIGTEAAFLESQLTSFPGYKIKTLALCFGGRPKTPNLERYLSQGTQNGIPYENIAVLNVGSSPSKSPFDKSFNPLSIPRIRAGELIIGKTGLYAWLKYFEKHPEERFVSDGDPNSITIPISKKPRLNSEHISNRQIVTY